MSNKEKVDPRIKRTKRMFVEALISLIQENSDKSKLTVQEIANRAELNRATFYLHYQDIDDLMEQMIKENLDELNKTMKTLSEENQLKIESPRPQNRLDLFLDHFYRKAGLYKVMLENKDFRNRVFNLLLEITEFWDEHRKENGRLHKVPNQIIASSTFGIISWWLEEGTPFSPSYLANQIRQIHK
ncbi:TetR/AcrR family transcriptional regulator [Bacillus sp. 1NLA3E]|uniref:TetR/AcrR family transcriptional regulator n=1 Tax=Bacillus sp. 1NLA3E TaxID=666686 RepID=UPI000247F1B8|nr:TetR/AcrR family transcriptional regulator [Bacillus sp. 1NLA3E]AGK54048.1 putative TetR family transcriptional regulator [Bacillus sp. 1NLA3E]